MHSSSIPSLPDICNSRAQCFPSNYHLNGVLGVAHNCIARIITPENSDHVVRNEQIHLWFLCYYYYSSITISTISIITDTTNYFYYYFTIIFTITTITSIANTRFIHFNQNKLRYCETKVYHLRIAAQTSYRYERAIYVLYFYYISSILLYYICYLYLLTYISVLCIWLCIMYIARNIIVAFISVRNIISFSDWIKISFSNEFPIVPRYFKILIHNKELHNLEFLYDGL